MKRKILSTLLSLCLIATIFAAFTLTASAATSTFNISYDTQGGSQIADTSAVAGDCASIDLEPKLFGSGKTGTYVGQVGSYYSWEYGSGFVSPQTGKQTMETGYTTVRNPSKGTTFYSDTNGTEHSSFIINKGYYNYSATVTSAVPSRANYTFNGWNTAADGTGTSYAAGAAIENSITLYAQWTADITASNFETTTDSGYYAEAVNSETKSGAVVFNSFFNQYGIYESAIDSFGLFLYQTGNEVKKISIDSTVADVDADDLTGALGCFYATVEDIAEANFDDTIVAMPYVVIKGQTYYGDILTGSVNPTKWLGEKAAE